MMAVVFLGTGVVPSQAQDDETTTTGGEESTTTNSETTSPPTTEGSTTSSTLSAEEQEEVAEATASLNAAKADDTAIASALKSINEEVQATQSKIGSAESQLETANATITAAAELVEASNEEQVELEDQLRTKAIEGFMSGESDADAGILFSDQDMNDTLRQNKLIQRVNQSTIELIEELLQVKEDRQVAQAEAEQAALDAEALEAELSVELALLEDQQDDQLALKGEAESRIAQWESELSAYAAQDAEIQDLIGDTAATPVSQIREPSSLGFQWPVSGSVTSPYGYRVHPVYGTRKLHSGMDIGVATGTPISAAGEGTVIFVGVQGGYGNTVIIDHGLGVTSLYAHMSQFGTTEGTNVGRGDIIGYVGQTGTATGPHLHFEIRLSGSTTDPAPYLP